jgi:glycosyltransferase involved in cell wall biosynthesis
VSEADAATLVSFVIPAYNHAAYVRQTIESLWAQTHRPIEIIVVDDASSDATPDILHALVTDSPVPMRFERHTKNRGVSQTFLDGARLARGAFVWFIASDDWLAPEAVATLMAAFAADPARQVVFGNGVQVLEDTAGQWVVEPGKLNNDVAMALLGQPPQTILAALQRQVSPIFIQTALIRRAFYEACGAHDPRCAAIDDWVLNLRMFAHLQDKCQYAFVDVPLCYRRLHASNSHKSAFKHWQAIETVYKHYAPSKLRRKYLRAFYQQCLRMLSAQSGGATHRKEQRYFQSKLFFLRLGWVV